MRLPLFRSKAGLGLPNLVGLQDPIFNEALPTVLVCPLVNGATVTAVRTTITVDGKEITVLCDLARPIRKSGFRESGLLDPESSRRIVETFLRLLPRE